MRKIRANRPIDEINEEVVEILRQANTSVVFHEVRFVDAAKGVDGDVQLVYLSTRTEYEPNVDVACLLHFAAQNACYEVEKGVVHVPSKLQKIHKMISLGLELWYWQDRFWIKGVNKLGAEWYQPIKGTRCFALYPLEVANADQLIAHIWSNYGKQ